jgi:hypothetical protein
VLRYLTLRHSNKGLASASGCFLGEEIAVSARLGSIAQRTGQFCGFRPAVATDDSRVETDTMNLRDPQAQAQAQTLEARLQPPQPQTEDEEEEALLDSASDTTTPTSTSTSSHESSLETQVQTPETPVSSSLQEEQQQLLQPPPPPSSVQSSHINLPVRAKSRDRYSSRQTESGQQAAAEAQAAAATARAVQAQHQHIQLQNLLYLGSPMNGINGTGAGMQAPGVNAGAAMAVGPTPAGHQAELNVIYGLVEELSRQLSENRRQTEEIVSGIGRVRHRARERALGNDEVLGEAADEIYGMFYQGVSRARILQHLDMLLSFLARSNTDVYMQDKKIT